MKQMKQMKNQIFWGIDLGGTKIEGAVLDDNFKVLARLRVPTEQEHGYEHIINQIKKVVDLLATETGQTPTTIGIGTPGTLDPITQTIKNSNTTCLNGQPMKADIETALGMPVKMANDANCFALAEAKMGIIPEKMPDAKVVFGVIMGTGCGGGIVINGEVLNGRQGIGGEWGHNVLEENGVVCYCGKTGCNEKVIAGPALENYYFMETGNQLSLKEIVKRHRIGTDEAATKTINRLTEMFAKAISVIINILDPDAIILGGGVNNIGEVMDEGVPKVEKYIFNNRMDTVFLKPKLGDSAGVFGAAMLTT
jgi:predicted NBD/HSP70 family sugar kinase